MLHGIEAHRDRPGSRTGYSLEATMYSFDATMRESRGTSMGGEIGAWGLAPGPTAVSEGGLEPPCPVKGTSTSS